MDKLGYLLERQQQLAEMMSNREWYKKASTNDKLLLFTDAILDECSEAKDGLNWKKWKSDKPLDLEYLKEEYIDMLHFLLDIFNVLGMNEYEIVERYDAKHNENVARQVTGGKEGRHEYIQGRE